VADIARRARVGKGTVFRHFATKDDLLARSSSTGSRRSTLLFPTDEANEDNDYGV
jgi:hypothetical protein